MRRTRIAAILLAIALVAVGCGGSDDDVETTASSETAEGEAEAPAADGGASLAEICPDPLVIQTDWFPEAEHGALYELIGDDYTVDLEKKVVSGSMVNQGEPTGISIEVRTGGPAIGFQGPGAVMATDSSIHIGYAYTSDANTWGTTGLLQVMAPLEKNPQIIMWDPETYPDVKTIDDLAEAGVTVNVFAKETMLFFINDGRYPDELVDPSYDGAPARFIAEGGKIAQQGFASAEPYSYQNEFPEWGKEVAFQTFFDAGYQDYSQTLGIRPGDLETLRPCLEKVVPIVQQAQVDFINAPDRANAIIIDAVTQYNDFWTYSEGLAAFSVQQQKDLGLVGNGPDDILGNFDMARVQKHIDLMIATGSFDGIPEGFKAETMVTNEFIDESIGL